LDPRSLLRNGSADGDHVTGVVVVVDVVVVDVVDVDVVVVNPT